MNEILLAQAGPGPSPFGPIIVMGLIFAFFFFLVIRPQQKREREKEAVREGLKRGDEVVTIGGLFGRVVELDGSIVTLEIASNVRVRIERRAIEGLGSAIAKKKGKGD